MESAIKTLVTTFLSYTKGKENLDTKTFKKMVQQQFGSVMEVRTRECQTPNSTKTKQNLPETDFSFPFPRLSHVQDTDSSSSIKEMQQGLDENSDGKVSFQEYLTLIGYVANTMSQKKCASNQESS